MEDGSPWIAILITVVLVAINGMLASAEIAMMGLSGTKLEAAAQSGDKKARLLLAMKKSPSDFLSTIQISCRPFVRRVCCRFPGCTDYSLGSGFRGPGHCTDCDRRRQHLSHYAADDLFYAGIWGAGTQTGSHGAP